MNYFKVNIPLPIIIIVPCVLVELLNTFSSMEFSTEFASEIK